MSRLRHWARVDDWRWRILVPQFCDPVWLWAMQLLRVFGATAGEPQMPRWTAPPMPMIDPDKEGLAYMRNVRAGVMSHSEALRERGYDPDETLEELAADFERLDRLELVLDIDPRKMTQAGQAQAEPKEDEPPQAPPAPGDRIQVNVTPAPVTVNAAAAPVTVNAPITNEARQPEDEVAPPEAELAEASEIPDGLTERQRDVLERIRSFRERGGGFPTVSQLSRELRIDRKTVRGHLEALRRRNALRTATPDGLPVEC
jgi:hypothetical protein